MFELVGCGRGGGPCKSSRQEFFEGLEYTRRSLSLVAGLPSASCVRGAHQEHVRPSGMHIDNRITQNYSAQHFRQRRRFDSHVILCPRPRPQLRVTEPKHLP